MRNLNCGRLWTGSIAGLRLPGVSVSMGVIWMKWRNRARAWCAVYCLFFFAISVSAHHAFTAEFDIHQPITLAGTVTRTDWINPHVQIYLMVPDQKGVDSPWRIESWGTGNCRRYGLPRNSLPPGTPVTVYAYRAKDGTKNFAYLRSIEFQDGHKVELWIGGAKGTPEEQGLL